MSMKRKITLSNIFVNMYCGYGKKYNTVTQCDYT